MSLRINLLMYVLLIIGGCSPLSDSRDILSDSFNVVESGFAPDGGTAYMKVIDQGVVFSVGVYKDRELESDVFHCYIAREGVFLYKRLMSEGCPDLDSLLVKNISRFSEAKNGLVDLLEDECSQPTFSTERSELSQVFDFLVHLRGMSCR